MSPRNTKRYCADPDALSALKRDGMGWGHDLECGSFYETADKPRPNGLTRFIKALKRRT